MAKTKFTLGQRIAAIIIIYAVFLIAVFVYIQLYNHVSALNTYKAYQAKFGGFLAKKIFEDTLRYQVKEGLAQDFSETLKSFQDAGFIEEGAIIDKEGRIVSATDSGLTGSEVPYRDLLIAEGIFSQNDTEKWLIPRTDEEKDILTIFVAIFQDNTASYVAKFTYSMAKLKLALLDVYRPAIIAALLVVAASILLGYILSVTLIRPLLVLNSATKSVAEGNLNSRVEIHTRDEIEELAHTFNYMTAELIKMKERAENANPLTKLPGNVMIQEQVENRIRENRKFMVIYCDLDNFKAFNDKYGIAKGDEAIKLTAQIFKEAVKCSGDISDFIGHEGGDDFILVTTPEKEQEVTNYIIAEFNKRIRGLYTPEDLANNCIIAKDREGNVKEFPIMSISLAGVTNATRTITSYAQVTNIAAEVKKKAKALAGSVYVVDKRSGADLDKEHRGEGDVQKPV